MDPDSEPDTQRALSLQWKSYKLVQDPATRRVNNKIYRYDGVHFSVPDSGFPPVGDLRDPRPRRIWSRHTEMALPVPKFKLDEFYVGPIPLKEVTFARLNDNIKEPFLAEMCAKFGEVEEMEILFHPKTRKHLGLARVLFTSTRGAKDTVKQLHSTSVMGNIIHAQLDIKGQQRQKYYDLIVSGSYTPQTVPTGGKALTERFQPPAPTQPDTSSDIRRRLSSEIAGLAAGLAAGVPALTPGSTTPCSVDTGFSEQRLDTTPSSMGGPYTPGSSASSQGGGTPYTPRSVSQDSGYAVARQVGYSAGPLTSGYPPQDMLPSSSCSSSTVSSSVGAYKAPRYSEDPHAPPQDPYQRCRPTYPPTGPFRPNEPPLYPTYPNAGGAGQHMAHHPAMPPPPPAPQYEQPPLADRDRERDRERDRDSGGRYGAGGTGSRRSSYQEANSSSKYSHHSHHSERERGYRRDSLGSREHGRHRNHHSHNHSSSSSSSRRRSSHDRDSRERDRDSDYSNSSDPRFNSNSHRSSSNSLSPPPSAYPSYSSSKDQPPPHNPSVSSRLEPSSVYRAQPSGAGSGERGSVSDKDPRSHHTPLPPPPPPPLPPASVIAAAVAETLSALDFGQESPVREETWTKPKRRPTTPPPPPQHPSTPPSSPPHSSMASSSTSPSSTSLPHHLPSSTSLSPPPQRDSSSPEPDSTNESLPFVYHSSSLDSRIEMLLKEQKAKFSFLPSDEDEEEDRKEERQREKVAGEGGAGKGGAAGEGRSNKQSEQDGEKDRRRRQGGDGGGQQRRKGERDKDGRRGRKQRMGGEGRKSPTVVAQAPSSSTFSPRVPTTDDHTSLHGTGPLQPETAQPEPIDPRTRQGAQTPPYNGKSQSSPHSSGEDMEISDEDEEHTITAVTTHHATPSSVSSPSSSQAPLPSQTDPSTSPSEPTQHFGTSMPAPPIPSYPPHLPPPGFSLQPPPPPCIPPPLGHMELHPEYPPHMPPHMYDYASSMELMNQYSGGAPMSFQMQTQMLSRLHQLRMSSSNGTAAPGDAPPSDYYHSMPPPPHHPYMDQEGGGYEQDQHYMPPHMPYAYPGPSQMPHHHAIPPPHTGWASHVLPEHYAYHTPPPYGTMPPVGGEAQYGAEGDPQMPLLTENPHEATVQLVLATLIQEMKSIMQRDLNRKMVENIAFGTFDEWWERKETKAKPFQTMVRGVAAVRDEDKKEENKASSKPREPLMSLVDWAKSGGMEGFSLRGALRLPSFKVKRKEPLELAEVGEMKRPKTPPEDDDEDSYHDKGLEGRMADGEGHRAERDSRRRKKKTRSRKPWDLDSEGEETSDGSSSDKEDEEEGSDKGSEDEALSADSDDESLSSSTESSSSSTSSSSSSSEDEDEEEGEQAGSGLDTMDESTMDSTALDTEKGDDREKSAAAVPKAPLSAEIKAEIAASKKDSSTLSLNARPPAPRPSSPIVIVPPLKKRRKTVSFSTGESDYKPHLPTVPLSPPPSTASPLLSHMKSHLPDSIFIASTPGTTPSKTLSLLPFASKPGEGNALSPSPVLTVPLPVRPEDSKNSPVPLVSPPITPTKSPNKRGASPKSPAPVWVCRTVQNLPLDHASMVKMAFEEAPPPVTKGRGRGRPRTVSLSTPTPPPSFHTLREEEEEEEEEGGLLRLGEQLGASSLLQLGSAPMADLSVLADVALKLDPDAGDSEETETSDEAEEQKMEEEMLLSPKALPLVMDPQGLSALQEHNYSKSPFYLIHAQKRSVSKQEPGVLLPADFNHHAISGVLEAPEEVIGEPLPSRDRHQAEYLSGMGLLCEDGDLAKASVLTSLTPSAKRKGMVAKGSELEEMGKEKNKKRRRKDKENLELQQTKKQKEHQTKKQKRKLEVDLEEDVDVEQLEPGELSNTEDEEEWDDVRKSERLFLQEAGLTSSQRWPKPIPAPEPVTFDQRSEFEQMTILYDIWNSGLDMEDMTLLKTTYEKLLQDDHSTDWLNDTHWVHHTVTNIPNPRRKKKSADGQLREHVTGCARSEGYYAISRKEKDVYLDLELPEQALLEAADYDASGSNRLLSERRSEQRRLLSAIGIPAVMDSDLLKLNQLKFRKKKLRFGRSRIHEWGLFTMEPIAADEMVIEYVGQNIRQMVADNREKRYAQQGIGSSYLFRVDHDTIIDATKLGNLARFINHCCTPNCYAKVITIESQKKIVIYSKQAIGMNEEITYDYKFPLEENKIPCLCGTENCRGTLN
ncbi:histone-lysine N-methyltransferase SETD1A isoform X2 [Oncorhynchus mykiss]|uniref:histone-lysine N-methyltransferase SETD1A isoform X2 n=1 Tax=Oncorhynchus mykiss TaxID=8022 RepID=UPI0018777643|nr:histone-lysine N-methyltransferase SETD1A isoform X2 [Oncorhynchus mykiss]